MGETQNSRQPAGNRTPAANFLRRGTERACVRGKNRATRCGERAEGLDVEDSLRRLDGIAKRVESETTRHYCKFRNHPEEFNGSEGYFRMLLMAVVLQEDLRISYNPERITEVGRFEPNDIFFADSRDIFIHGLIGDDRRMGTCASLPVLYTQSDGGSVILSSWCRLKITFLFGGRTVASASTWMQPEWE